MFTDEEINKLPKWAQIRIRTLQMRLNEAKTEINQLKDAPESNTIVGWDFRISDDEPPIHYLKNNQRITFKLKNGTIAIRVDDDVLDINSHTDFNTNLCVMPLASNGIKIALK